ncbi:histone H1/5 [Chloropicon roscoffensis]|uniref:Histone H1/5 n=1 Tax=Chloropicon roscoffensis TaxID=1461544 RepID=A0AAX4P5V8_9CHLO
MPRTPAKKAKKAAASHPPYATMVQEAIKDLKDRTGSSTVAIAKWVESKYTLPDTFKKSLSTALKKMTEDGKLVKVKASYKLGAALKAAPKKKVVKKKPAAPKKKPATKVTKKKVVKKKPKKVVKKPKKAAPKKKTTAPKKKIVKKKK